MGVKRRTNQSTRARSRGRRVATRCTSVGAVVLGLFAGCGGQVEEPYTNNDDSSADGGDASGGGSGTKPLFNGSCVKCEDLYECGFCLIQIYETTYVCPPGKSAPKSGCWSLGESHTTASGEPFTCYYCDG